MDKKVIFIEPQETNEKPVEFTHRQKSKYGWVETDNLPKNYRKIVYLGKCSFDGDMFAAYGEMCIDIFKGHLNSGKY